jgi:hypothetical protein
MRKSLILLPILLGATPVPAQPPASSQALPPQLLDPRMAGRLADTMQAMSQAFLNLPVGEVQAALEGREPTPAEKKITVRDLGRRDDPNFDRNFHQQIAQARPMIEHSMKALNEALPAMKKALDEAEGALERATANMPDPTYPKR